MTPDLEILDVGTVAPIPAMPTRMVVRAGEISRASGTSSKPAIAMRPGTATPARRKRIIAPIAIMALAANSA